MKSFMERKGDELSERPKVVLELDEANALSHMAIAEFNRKRKRKIPKGYQKSEWVMELSRDREACIKLMEVCDELNRIAKICRYSRSRH